MFDRITYPPRGREGGQCGATGRFYLRSGDALRAKGRQIVPAGDRVVMEMPGGGGYGDPLKRDPENVAHDVAEGLVSVQSAAEDYGVVLNANGDVDDAATTATRANRNKRDPM